MSRVQLSGARVVVTGAGCGSGRATALRCARLGSEVACVDINAESAKETAAACEQAGPAASAWTCDVADSAAVLALADAIESERGPVDVVVNNAGVGVGGPFLETAVGDWDWLIGINLNGVAYGCHAFGKRMVERRHGHVVNIASSAAFLMSRDLAAYCASKSAVVALSRCLRADWAAAGVGVSAICPGLINTAIPSNTRMYGPLAANQERIQRAFKIGHSPDLVAKAIVRAVERNSEVVPVGIEAEVLYRVLPLMPKPVQGWIWRTPLGRVV